MKRTVRILRLYPDLLDLYGDGGNLLVLRRRLEAMGHEVVLDSMELSDPKDLTQYDLIAVGAGKTRNLAAAMKDFAPLKESLVAAVDAGCTVLATGTGMLLLGQGLQVGEEQVKGAGLFDYQGVETGKVSVSDCILTAEFLSEPLYGFVNQTVSIDYHQTPNLFRVIAGQTGREGAEGMTRGRCYATAMLGPVLVKNPAFCRHLLQEMLGEDFEDYDDTLACLAHQKTMEEF